MAKLLSTNNLSDIASAEDARTNIDVYSYDEFDTELDATSAEIRATSSAVQYRLPGGAWTDIMPLSEISGADGSNTDGTQWYTGVGRPGAQTGNSGDYYLDTDSGNIWFYVRNGWSQIANIKGAAGDAAETIYTKVTIVVAAGANIATTLAGYGLTSDEQTSMLKVLHLLNGDDSATAHEKLTITFTRFTDATVLDGANWHMPSMRYTFYSPTEINTEVGYEYVKDGDIILMVHNIYTDALQTSIVAHKGDCYIAANGEWVFLLNLVGKQGTICLTGISAPSTGVGTGMSAREGDYYFATGTGVKGNLYRLVNGEFIYLMNLVGAEGEQGEDGEDDLVLDAQAIGTYVIARLTQTLVTAKLGAQVDGSALVPASVEGRMPEAGTLPGTWQCLGYALTDGDAADSTLLKPQSTTLWMRVS